MGHYNEQRAAERSRDRQERRLRLQRALDDIVEGRRTLHVSQDALRSHDRVSRAADMVSSAIDLLQLEIIELDDAE